PKAAGWLFLLATSASVSSLAFSLYHAALGGLGRDDGMPTFTVTLWLTFAFGLGYVATKGLHLPDQHRSRDARPEAAGDAAGEACVAESSGDPEAPEGGPGRPAAPADRPTAGPTDTTGSSTASVPTARAIAIAAPIGVPAFVFLVIITWGAI